MGKNVADRDRRQLCAMFLIVEADSVQDAIDELADDEKYGHLITVADEDLGDYDPDDCHYGPVGSSAGSRSSDGPRHGGQRLSISMPLLRRWLA